MSAVVRPLEVHGTPCETSAEGSEDDVVTSFQLRFPIAQAQWNGRRRGVAVFLDVDHHFFGGETHAALGSVDDAQIGLVWHQPRDVFRCLLYTSPSPRDS